MFVFAALLAPLATAPLAFAHPLDEAHPRAEPDERHASARLGQISQVYPGIMVRPLALIEDSRCPINALCVQAGQLVLRIELMVRGRKSEHLLTLQAPAKLAGGTLTLTAAQPQRGEVTPHPLPHEMRFSFTYRPDFRPPIAPG